MLSRKRRESIVIGDGEARVSVTVVQVRGDRVKLGIEAPIAVPIRREELPPPVPAGGEPREEVPP